MVAQATRPDLPKRQLTWFRNHAQVTAFIKIGGESGVKRARPQARLRIFK